MELMNRFEIELVSGSAEVNPIIAGSAIGATIAVVCTWIYPSSVQPLLPDLITQVIIGTLAGAAAGAIYPILDNSIEVFLA